MIAYNNKEKFEVTLKAVNVDDIENGLIKLKHKEVFFDLQNKTVLVGFEKEIDKEIYHYFQHIIANVLKIQKWNMNIDLDSFLNQVDKEDKKAIVFDAIIENILYLSHNQYDLKTKSDKIKTKTQYHYNLIGDQRYERRLNTEIIKMEYVNITRNFQDIPPNICTPTYFANEIVARAKKLKEVKVTVLTKKEIQDLEMNLLLAVNAGSHEEPRVVVVEYNSNPSLERTAIVGKGITFDSGGYSLKPSAAMPGMKMDMSGAAVAVDTVLALAQAGAHTNVVAIAVLTENRIGGHATLVESVVKSMNGKTVEIANTDAEGRLVLADGMTYAIRIQKANRLIDVATLTGAIRIALGAYMTGVFSSDEDFYDELVEATKTSHEEIWRLPIHRVNYANMRRSSIADLTNAAKGPEGGSSNAAAFLEEFSEKKPFIHLDIAGSARIMEEGRGNAVMLKTLFELLENPNEH